MTILINIISAMYLGYVVVFVVLPGIAADPQDYIWGVMCIYMHVFLIIWTICLILWSILKKLFTTGSDEDLNNNNNNG